METFYITYDQFWEWFDRDEDNYDSDSPIVRNKRMKTDRKPRMISETEAASRTDLRYIIMYGPHKPGKKTKTWVADGKLSLVGQMAHLCTLEGRMIEEPTILDEIDLKSIEKFGELLIGNTEVQVVEVDKGR